MIAAVFAMQGVGILLAALIAVISMLIFRSSIERDPYMLDYVWRLIVGFGCVPACIALYYRLTIPESPRYTADVELNIDKAISHTRKVMHQENGYIGEKSIGPRQKPNTWKDFRGYFFGSWKNFKILFGASICWFLLDIAFYGLSLNQSMVLDIVTPHQNVTHVYDTIWNSVKGNLIIALLGSVPGYDGKKMRMKSIDIYYF
jgi:PHS family inorganic phosphate transporter-like MFS transporter